MKKYYIAIAIAFIFVVTTGALVMSYGYKDWFLRKSMPLSTKLSVLDSGIIGAGDDVVLVNVSGRGGVVKSFLLKVGNVPAPEVVGLTITVDGETLFEADFTIILDAFKDNSGNYHYGYSKPISLIYADETNGVYILSWTDSLDFGNSVKITLHNLGTSDFYYTFQPLVSLVYYEIP